MTSAFYGGDYLWFAILSKYKVIYNPHCGYRGGVMKLLKFKIYKVNIWSITKY